MPGSNQKEKKEPGGKSCLGFFKESWKSHCKGVVVVNYHHNDLCEFQTWSFWRAYNLQGKTIRTDTMKALERRGIVKIEFAVGEKRSDYMAKLKK